MQSVRVILFLYTEATSRQTTLEAMEGRLTEVLQ